MSDTIWINILAGNQLWQMAVLKAICQNFNCHIVYNINDFLEITAQEEGDRRKRTSDRAQTQDLPPFAELQSWERETKDLWLESIAEAPRKSVGSGFELSRWSFFSCCLPLEQWFPRSYLQRYTCSHRTSCMFTIYSCYVYMYVYI